MVLNVVKAVAVFFTVLIQLSVSVAKSEEQLLTGFSSHSTDTSITHPKGHMPLGVTMSVIDSPCKSVINSILLRLEMLGLTFEWTNQDEGALTVGPIVGPIVQELETGGTYSTVRETYFLKIVCHDELSTNISGAILLEGLESDGQRIGITDSKTIAKHGLEFFQKRGL